MLIDSFISLRDPFTEIFEVRNPILPCGSFLYGSSNWQTF